MRRLVVNVAEDEEIKPTVHAKVNTKQL